MNAKRYLEVKGKIHGLYPWVAPLTIIFSICGMIAYIKAFGLRNQNFLLVLAGIFLCVMLPFFFGTWEVITRLEKRFARNHPEMDLLDEWIAIMGSETDYPLNRKYSLALITKVSTKLGAAARSANAAFAVRDRIKQAIEPFCNSPLELALAQPIYDELAQIAEERNRQYLAEWNLLMDRMHVMPQAITPQTFRESFIILKKK